MDVLSEGIYGFSDFFFFFRLAALKVRENKSKSDFYRSLPLSIIIKLGNSRRNISFYGGIKIQSIFSHSRKHTRFLVRLIDGFFTISVCTRKGEYRSWKLFVECKCCILLCNFPRHRPPIKRNGGPVSYILSRIKWLGHILYRKKRIARALSS